MEMYFYLHSPLRSTFPNFLHITGFASSERKLKKKEIPSLTICERYNLKAFVIHELNRIMFFFYSVIKIFL